MLPRVSLKQASDQIVEAVLQEREERDEASRIKYHSVLSEGDRLQELYDEVFKQTEHAASTQEHIDLDL